MVINVSHFNALKREFEKKVKIRFRERFLIHGVQLLVTTNDSKLFDLLQLNLANFNLENLNESLNEGQRVNSIIINRQPTNKVFSIIKSWERIGTNVYYSRNESAVAELGPHSITIFRRDDASYGDTATRSGSHCETARHTAGAGGCRGGLPAVAPGTGGDAAQGLPRRRAR